MRRIIYRNRLLRELRLMRRRGKNLAKFDFVADLLAQDKPLPARCRDHALSGNWKNHRSCHIEPDWILIYQIIAGENGEELRLERTGAHADIYYRVSR